MIPQIEAGSTSMAFPDPGIFYSPETIGSFIRAVRSLAEFKGSVERIPNRSMFIDAIPLQEARASCLIENIVTSLDEIYRSTSVKEGRDDFNEREVLHYRGALQYATGRPISIETVEGICSILKQKDMRIRRSGEQVYLKDPADGSVVFTPPDGSDVEGLLSQLLDFVNDASVDPLIRVVVSHPVFEMIHPFIDGNGRTGRILNVMILMESGLLDGPDLFLSRYLMDNRRDYYRHLRRIERDGTENDWKLWIRFMLDGISEMAMKSLKQVDDMVQLYNETCERCKDMDGYSRDLMDVVFSKVYCRISDVVDAGISERNTASKYLHALEERGVLEGERVGRSAVFKNKRLMEILGK